MLQLQKRLKETQEIKCFKQKKPKQEIAIRFVFYKLQPKREGYTKLTRPQLPRGVATVTGALVLNFFRATCLNKRLMYEKVN